MNTTDRTIWFVGDRADPAARAIVAALPRAGVRVIDAPGGLPKPWPGVGPNPPRVVVVHRAILGSSDAERLAKLRGRLGDPTRVILCVGPQARHAEVERWSRWADVILPEALAATTIGRHVASVDRPVNMLAQQAAVVVSTNSELRATLASMLRSRGCAVDEQAEPEEATPAPESPTFWDVPVLEPGWPDRLAARAQRGPVVALIGFLDATQNRRARGAGAAVCLDLPVDLDDLVAALDQARGLRRDPAHLAPPAPNVGRHPRRSRRSRPPGS